MYVLSHPQLIATSASGDGDEVGVSFNRSPLSFETTTDISLLNQVISPNPTLVSAERWHFFFEKLILVSLGLNK